MKQKQYFFQSPTKALSAERHNNLPTILVKDTTPNIRIGNPNIKGDDYRLINLPNQ